MPRNRFTSTGIEALDRCIDLQLDHLRDPERFEGAAGQLQGIRTALSSIDHARYGQTLAELAELIAERDR